MADHTAEVSLGIAAWYLTSFGTLLLNKYLLGTYHIQPNSLAVVQMVSTAIYGALKTLQFRKLFAGGGFHEVCPGFGGKLPTNGSATVCDDLEDPSDAHKGHRVESTLRRGLAQMAVVGAMRFATVVLGLVSLKYIAASFTETIKASAPFFTVVIAYMMLGEKTKPSVVLSLVPVATGLVLVSCSELSFNITGFSAAVATNIIECVQNVFSKRLLAKDYTASQLQFYTSLTALLLQAPIFLSQFDMGAVFVSHGPHLAVFANGTVDGAPTALDDTATPEPGLEFSWGVVGLLWIDGVLYHLQSVVAYVVMSYLSPVTVSVVNTLKRALLIWISVLVFHNKVTRGAGIGTAICLGGALCYNVARQAQSAPSGAKPQKPAGGVVAAAGRTFWKPGR